MEKKVTSHIAKGFIVAAVMITFDVIGYYGHFREQTWIVPVLGCILLAGVIWGCISFGKQSPNPVTFGAAFTYGFRMTAVITCIWFLYTLLAVNVLFPGSIDEMVQRAVEQAKKSPDYSEEKMKANLGMARTILKAVIFAGTVLVCLAVGVVGSLIGSVIAQNT